MSNTEDITISTSWSSSSVLNVINAEYYNSPELKFNPFTFEGDFAVMYNPGLTVGDGFSTRMISSLGMEVATYVPEHLNPEDQWTWENVGYTTGFGPQVGVGVAVTAGPLTSYVLGTLALGVVSNSEAYVYQSKKMEVGVRYGNAINIRYTIGQQDWAPSGLKRVKTNHQFTIGVLLESLFQ